MKKRSYGPRECFHSTAPDLRVVWPSDYSQTKVSEDMPSEFTAREGDELDLADLKLPCRGGAS